MTEPTDSSGYYEVPLSVILLPFLLFLSFICTSLLLRHSTLFLLYFFFISLFLPPFFLLFPFFFLLPFASSSFFSPVFLYLLFFFLIMLPTPNILSSVVSDEQSKVFLFYNTYFDLTNIQQARLIFNFPFLFFVVSLIESVVIIARFESYLFLTDCPKAY